MSTTNSTMLDTTKLCSRCRESFPATAEYFYFDKQRKQFRSKCRKCIKDYSSELYSKPKEHYQLGDTKTCSTCDQAFLATTDFFYFDKRRKRLHRDCIQCVNTYNRLYYETHKEPRLIRSRAYNLENKEAKATRDKAYILANKEYVRDWHKTYYLNNKERELARSAAWAQENKAYVLERARAWRKATPGRQSAKETRRRARRAGVAINDFTDEQWQTLLKCSNYRCAYCPSDCPECRNKTHELTRDHITAITKGGDNTLHNIVVACRSCNAKKHTNPAPHYVQPLLL